LQNDAADDNSKTCAERFGKGAISQWVSYDANGKLKYKPLSDKGDRIMDYSYAGNMGGGVAVPAVQAAETVKPSGGDDTQRYLGLDGDEGPSEQPVRDAAVRTRGTAGAGGDRLPAFY
jgi:hypothetical protein